MCKMQNILKKIKNQAKNHPKRIVFPEGTEERTLKAVKIILREGFAKIILLGDEKEIKRKKKKINVNPKKTTIINPLTSEKIKEYAERFYLLRKHKGITPKIADKIVKDENYFGTMMVHLGDADGLVSGAIHTTAETVRPALQIIRTKEKYHRVSAVFLMKLKDKIYFFADCAVNINPTSEELAMIAIDTAKTAKEFGINPRVALLSFSTHESAKHELIEKVRNAVKIAKRKNPNLIIDGELQVDAAIVPFVAKIKCPKSKLKGNANVLIFPDLEVGNIAYKLVERLAKAKAIGPILQGLKKPVNDLSRGCSVDDIVNITAITVVEAQKTGS